jgi:hypothetical protein
MRSAYPSIPTIPGTSIPKYFERVEKEHAVAYVSSRGKANGKVSFAALVSQADGLSKLMITLFSGIAVAIFLITATLFSLGDAAWSSLFWWVVGVLSGIPLLMAFLISLTLVEEVKREYQKYEQYAALIKYRGW